MDEEYRNDEIESCTVEFKRAQFEEIVELALQCGLTVRELIMYRLLGYIED